MDEENFESLLTGKKHISFSELSDWYDCTWRHKLKQVEKIDLSTYGVALDNGHGLHASCEDFLPTRKMNAQIAVDHIIESFKKQRNENNFYDYVRFDPDNYDKLLKKYKGECTEKEDIIYDSYLSDYVEGAKATLADVPAFMDENFEDWEFIDAEHQLYEKIGDHPHAFKGFIDGIIKCKGARGKTVYWLLDWKTSAWGWTRNKKQDPKTKLQLIYYKKFWSEKMGIDIKDIRCGFVLLKRAGKPGNHCELIPVSAGDVTITRSLNIIDNMFASLDRKMFIKNKLNCKWCDYKNTEHCPGTILSE